MFSLIIFLSCAIIPPHSKCTTARGNLLIEVENIEAEGGFIWVGIYHSESDFLVKEKAIIEGVEVKKSGNLLIPISDLPFGTYAVALFHDLNGNGEMDRNLLGIPSEPYAFSGLIRSKFRLPKFKEIQFQFAADGQLLHTTLRKWWK